MKLGLTRKQVACLSAIKRLTTADGVSPSYDCLMAELGLSSKNGVHRLIHALKDRGFITLNPHQARSIRIVHSIEMVAQGAAVPTVTEVRRYLQVALERRT
jgi:SOS-response transcriptional repressor LexA